MIAILFQILCFLILSSMIMCVIPEPEKPYTPRDPPPFNQRIWEPTEELLEQHPMKCRWTIPSSPKPAAPPPAQIPPIQAV